MSTPKEDRKRRMRDPVFAMRYHVEMVQFKFGGLLWNLGKWLKRKGMEITDGKW